MIVTNQKLVLKKFSRPELPFSSLGCDVECVPRT